MPAPRSFLIPPHAGEDANALQVPAKVPNRVHACHPLGVSGLPSPDPNGMLFSRPCITPVSGYVRQTNYVVWFDGIHTRSETLRDGDLTMVAVTGEDVGGVPRSGRGCRGPGTSAENAWVFGRCSAPDCNNAVKPGKRRSTICLAGLLRQGAAKTPRPQTQQESTLVYYFLANLGFTAGAPVKIG
jgi:hypothetical protein